MSSIAELETCHTCGLLFLHCSDTLTVTNVSPPVRAHATSSKVAVSFAQTSPQPAYVINFLEGNVYFKNAALTAD